jgi:hypothetical protein
MQYPFLKKKWFKHKKKKPNKFYLLYYDYEHDTKEYYNEDRLVHRIILPEEYCIACTHSYRD